MPELNLWTIFITSLFAGGGAYFGAYLKKRAEIKAITEQHQALLTHLSEQTQLTEKIKSEFELIKQEVQQKNWVEQQRWEFRKELFLPMIEMLLDIQDHCLSAEKFLNKIPSLYNTHEDNFDAIDKEQSYLFDQANEIYNGPVKKLTTQLKSLVNKKGVLFLSTQVIEVLDDFFKAEEIRQDNLKESFKKDIETGVVTQFNYSYPDSFERYLYHKSYAAKLAYQALIKAAKDDLKINS
ncbi:hypothetical protein Q4503_13725 [Colwellia sp. 6_MG-2023]|uniref:hypothetical protein n=1 Tax=Colwellia sp. 6_MG-2023 TaxID=3062676 RepID=UPI0026E228B2|nr:hypothetical protein [Colwellia sp. 6_MG-2023]MDO6488761.1 hypothetical protein [Colwellia sp. 6_MG-2023]